MTIAKNLKSSTVKTLIIGLCALGLAGQVEARDHHHKESKGRQAADIIHMTGHALEGLSSLIRAVKGEPEVVVAPAPAAVVAPAPVVVAPPPVVTPAPVITPAPVVVTPAPVVVTPPRIYRPGPIVRPVPRVPHGRHH